MCSRFATTFTFRMVPTMLKFEINLFRLEIKKKEVRIQNYLSLFERNPDSYSEIPNDCQCNLHEYCIIDKKKNAFDLIHNRISVRVP